jgi:tetratricopeptide (TPR) repeat protein
MNAFYEKYHEKSGLEIFGIYTPVDDKDIPESELAKVQNLVKVNKIKFPVLIDKGFEMFREYGIIAMPTTVMVNKTGKIKFIYPSFPIAAQQLFTERIKELIGVADVAQKKEGEKEEGPDSHSNRLYHYALQMYKKGLMEQSLSPLKKSMDLNPEFTWSHNLMGIILWKMNNFEGSIKEFEYAIKIDRNNAPAHFNYGLLLYENEKYSEAEKHLHICIAIDNTMAEAHYVLGIIYNKVDKPDKAMKELKTSLALFKKRKSTSVIIDSSAFHRISTLYALSDLYARNGDNIKAMNLLQEAMQVALGIENKTEEVHLLRSKELMVYE